MFQPGYFFASVCRNIFSSTKIILAILILLNLLTANLVLAQDPPRTPEDFEREAAIAKYSGIPEPDLNQHTLDVYKWLSQGYDHYGIKFEKVPNLKMDEMYAEIKSVKLGERARQVAKLKAEGRWDEEATHSPEDVKQKEADFRKSASTNTKRISSKPPVNADINTSLTKKNWILWLAGLLLAALALSFLMLRKKTPPEKDKP